MTRNWLNADSNRFLTWTFGLKSPRDRPDFCLLALPQETQQDPNMPEHSSLASQSTFWPESMQVNMFLQVPEQPLRFLTTCCCFFRLCLWNLGLRFLGRRCKLNESSEKWSNIYLQSTSSAILCTMTSKYAIRLNELAKFHGHHAKKLAIADGRRRLFIAKMRYHTTNQKPWRITLGVLAIKVYTSEFQISRKISPISGQMRPILGQMCQI